MKRLAFVIAVAAIFGLGCWRWSIESREIPDAPLGETVTVVFRADTLGAQMGSPMGPLTTNMNGADVAVTGKLLAANSGWLHVETSGPGNPLDVWIPVDVVLTITKSKN